jgi:bud emergence protein 1
MMNPPQPKSPKATTVFYAVVQHDFQAERTDELDAKKGDAISVVAHSNREWFVAKPIGKLGGPGLIPASFLELRDPLTGQVIDDIDGLIDQGELPPVEEWKKATMNYKASSIALGVIDSPNSGPVPNSKFQAMAMTSPGAEHRYTFDPTTQSAPYIPDKESMNSDQTYVELPEPDLSRLELADPLPPGVLIRAGVSSFHYEANEWLFRIDATFRPDPPAKKNPFDPNPTMSRELTLFRVYDDFYVFQIQLLAAFPIEAGRDPERPNEPLEEDEDAPSTRILPFMPGPQDDVDESVTDTRRHDLDVYLKELVALREVGAEHILRCDLVRKFFAAREGDIENEVAVPDPEDDYGADRDGKRNDYYDRNSTRTPIQNSSQRQNSEYHSSYDTQPRTTTSTYSSTRVPSSTDSSQYASRDPHPYARGQPQSKVRESSGSGDGSGYGRMSSASADRPWQEDGRYGSSHPYARDPGGASYGRGADSGVTSPTMKYSSPSYGSPKRRPGSPQRSPYGQNQNQPGHERDSDYRGHNTTPSTSTVNMSSSHGNPNSPRISQSNPNAAFVKIKIFHSSTDELIAIRVSPRVTRRQLMEKVRERLGNDVANVKYREGMAAGSGGTGHFVDIMDDSELRGWMGSGDKLVLYAE